MNQPGTRAFSSFAADVSIRITNVNDAPVIAPIPPQVGREDTTFTMTITVTDPDNGQVPTATATAFPNNSVELISLSPAPNRVLTVVPKPNAVGSEEITITASDGVLSGTLSFTLTFSEVNDPPVISAVSVDMDEDTVHNQNVRVTDIDSALANRVPTLHVTNTTLFPPGTASLTGVKGSFTLRFHCRGHPGGG